MRKHYLTAILLIIIVILTGLKLLFGSTITKKQDNTFQNITPGKTSQKNLEKNFGKPVLIEPLGNNDVYYYPVETQNWSNLFYVNKDKQTVDLIKNYSPGKEESYQSFINRFGNPDKKLYGPHAQNGFFVFVFLTKGVAVVANPDSGLIMEIWYFAPTTNEDFMIKYGQGLSTILPEQF